MRTICLEGSNNDILIKYVDLHQKHFVKIKSIYQRNQPIVPLKLICGEKIIGIYCLKVQKRPLDTLYLKEGQKEALINDIEEFYDPDTRADYVLLGIPYKSVIMLYGPPGTGKTSTINTIASAFGYRCLCNSYFKRTY